MLVKTVHLIANEETAIELSDELHAKIENRGSDTIYVSRNSAISAGADGVIAINGGTSKIMDYVVGLKQTNNDYDYKGTIYALSSSDCDVEVSTANDPDFFRQSLKGGEIVALKQQIALLNQQVNDLMSSGMKRKIVDTLPTEDIDENTIYMVPKSTAQEGNYYNEFIYTVQGWELIGDAQINLADYYTKTDVDSGFLKNLGSETVPKVKIGTIQNLGDGNIYIDGTSGTGAILCTDVYLALGCRSTRYINLSNTAFFPLVDRTIDLGLASKKFKNGYFNDISLGNDNTSLTDTLANKSDTNHNHDDKYLPVTGGDITGASLNIVGNSGSASVGTSSTSLVMKTLGVNRITISNVDLKPTTNMAGVMDLGSETSKFKNGYFSNIVSTNDVTLGSSNKSLTTALNSLAARLALLDSGASTVI